MATPSKTSKKLIKNYRFTPAFAERIERAARAEGLTQTALAQIALSEKIEKIEKKFKLALDT